MKSENLTKKALCIVLVIFAALCCTVTVFAEGEDETEYIEPPTEYIEPTTEYIEPVTEPPVTNEYDQTDPPAQTDYIEPTTEYAEPVTDEPVQNQTQVQYVDPVQATTEYFQAPTLAKTVSTKKYTTNYTAGIVSWVCVGVGVLTVSIVLISNKVSGRKSSVRR